MVVIAKSIINTFIDKYPIAKQPFNNWYQIVKQADWGNYAEMKKDFGSVDAVGNDRYVFNVKGNDFRLISMIFFDKRTVFIRFIGTHSDYNKIKDCSII